MKQRNYVRVALAMLVVSAALLAVIASAASAYDEPYGGASICGENCYVQSSGAHTFVYNEGFSPGEAYIACQLFNSLGVNNVSHGYRNCVITYGGGEFVWARVYNQGGFRETTYGFAHT